MRIAVADALRLATDLMVAAGLSPDMASAVAGKLVEADLLGHRTHGLAMLPTYLERLGDGRIARAGGVEIVADHGMTFSWQVPRLPGAWVMNQAIAQALERIATYPVVSFTIGGCSHIGALQAYLPELADRKVVALLAVTDPGVASVAPFGGVTPVLTTNPLAACIPSHGDPILIDQCTSLVSNATIAGYAQRGETLPGRWLMDNAGHASDDPNALTSTPPGSILPLGGEDFGYKGFALNLLVEALALGLSGFGRYGGAPPVRGAQGVFCQLIDPAHFGGRERFLTETTALIAACKASAPAQGSSGVRMPGERALALKREQLKSGVEIDDALEKRLKALVTR